MSCGEATERVRRLRHDGLAAVRRRRPRRLNWVGHRSWEERASSHPTQAVAHPPHLGPSADCTALGEVNENGISDFIAFFEEHRRD